MSVTPASAAREAEPEDEPEAEPIPVPPDSLLPPPGASPEVLHRHFLGHASLANWNNWRLMVLIRRMEACQGCERYACATLAAYLELTLGITGVAARERIRVAFARAGLSKIDAAFRSGALSYSKVRALTRVATAANEAEWLAAARARTAEEVEVMVARSQRGQPLARRLTVRALNATTTRMVVDLPVEEMEVLMRGLTRMRREAGGALSASESLVYMAADSLAGEVREISSAERYMVVVHAGKDGTAWAETEKGPAPLKPEVVERLLCDCSLRLAREQDDGSFVLSRRQRTVPWVTRRAVEIRDGRKCRVTGCDRVLWNDIHHRQWQSRGGRHQLKNLVLLCGFHHKLAHLGLLTEERDAAGEVRFRVPGWVLGEGGAPDDDAVWLWAQEQAQAMEAEANPEVEGEVDGERAAERAEPFVAGRDPEERGRWWRVREPRAGYGALPPPGNVPAGTSAVARGAGASYRLNAPCGSRAGQRTGAPPSPRPAPPFASRSRSIASSTAGVTSPVG